MSATGRTLRWHKAGRGAAGLTEHTSPFEALVMVVEGTWMLTIGATPVRATPGWCSHFLRRRGA